MRKESKMNKPTKSERVSFRCTKKEKEKLESRSEKLGMSLTDYAAKMLFSDVNDWHLLYLQLPEPGLAGCHADNGQFHVPRREQER